MKTSDTHGAAKRTASNTPVDAHKVGDLMVWGSFNREMLNHPKLREEYRYRVVRLGDRYHNLFIRRNMPPLPDADRSWATDGDS